jgi:CubicO group peptidase (beta-lactamase class C family)
MLSHHAAVLGLFLTLAVTAFAAPDEVVLGQPQGYPAAAVGPLAPHLVAGEQPQHLVDSFSGGLEKRLPHRVVKKPATPRPFAPSPAEPAFTYTHESQRRTVADYLNRQRVTGLLVIKDNAVVLERYQYGRTPATRFLSASMAKSIVGLLVGIALDEGRIRSLDDLARVYVPALAGNPYGETSIRDLLQMSSGVRFSEQYDGRDDLSALIEDTIGQRSAGGAAVLLPHAQRRVAPGKVFYYSSADTQALGLVLRSATGMPVADYFSERVWQPMGAQDDASFLIDAAGQEATFAFLHATLRDFGRLGLLLANEGKVGDRQVIPAEWLRQSTVATQAHTQPYVASSYFGYGNQFWVFPGNKRRFALIGVRGQVIFVDPELRLVLVQTAVWQSAGDRAARAELLALWRGMVEQYGAWGVD